MSEEGRVERITREIRELAVEGELSGRRGDWFQEVCEKLAEDVKAGLVSNLEVGVDGAHYWVRVAYQEPDEFDDDEDEDGEEEDG